MEIAPKFAENIRKITVNSNFDTAYQKFKKLNSDKKLFDDLSENKTYIKNSIKAYYGFLLFGEEVLYEIFNDDDEFATLTKLDKILLKILYDKRLKSGIVRNEAAQLVKQIAREVTAQD